VDPATAIIRSTRHLPSDADLSGVLFGHRRLSILDLTSSGSQPMVSDDGLSLLCFNGEIYNFVELRDELRGHGVSFRGTGDTEVLLKAYEQWGSEAFNRLNGMWAFALWDGRRRTLVVSRDRFGVKPLYWARLDGVTIFGSEIKAILAYPGAFRGVDDRKVLSFLQDGATDQGEDTMFRGIHSLAPGTYLEVTDGQTIAKRFWSLPRSDEAQASPEELIAQFARLLTESVRLRVRSDVPIGTMMSGGLDSTAITALIRAEQLNKSDNPFEGLRAFHHTFSVCWPGSANDEEAEIDLMCRELGLVSHRIYPSAEMVAGTLPAVVYHLDEPFDDPIAAVQYLLMREARGYGVKVVLNGHGSDELLAGYYKHFVPVFLADLMLSGRLLSFFREQRAFRGTGWPWAGVLWYLLLRLLPRQFRLDPAIPHRVFEQLRGSSGVFAPYDDEAVGETTSSSEPVPSLSHLNARLWFEFRTRNLPRWLRMEDRMSMASSVESRLPFMDYRLVEFAFTLPDSLKLHNGFNKYVLRQSMRELLPARVVATRAKQPFKAPYTEWLRGAWRPMIQDLLVNTCEVGRFLDYPRFREKLASYLDGNERALPTYLLWRVLNTELWLRMVRDQWGTTPSDRPARATRTETLPA
jgi:asparagine synthase (glutamine-hydrolysing)